MFELSSRVYNNKMYRLEGPFVLSKPTFVAFSSDTIRCEPLSSPLQQTSNQICDFTIRYTLPNTNVKDCFHTVSILDSNRRILPPMNGKYIRYIHWEITDQQAEVTIQTNVTGDVLFYLSITTVEGIKSIGHSSIVTIIPSTHYRFIVFGPQQPLVLGATINSKSNSTLVMSAIPDVVKKNYNTNIEDDMLLMYSIPGRYRIESSSHRATLLLYINEGVYINPTQQNGSFEVRTWSMDILHNTMNVRMRTNMISRKTGNQLFAVRVDVTTVDGTTYHGYTNPFFINTQKTWKEISKKRTYHNYELGLRILKRLHTAGPGGTCISCKQSGPHAPNSTCELAIRGIGVCTSNFDFTPYLKT